MKHLKKNFFIGRCEYWNDDFDKLFLKICDNDIEELSKIKKYYHTHKQDYGKDKLDISIVNRLKKFYQEEYSIIKNMCDIGLLPNNIIKKYIIKRPITFNLVIYNEIVLLFLYYVNFEDFYSMPFFVYNNFYIFVVVFQYLNLN